MQTLTVTSRISFAGPMMPLAYSVGYQTTDPVLIALIQANAPATSYTLQAS